MMFGRTAPHRVCKLARYVLALGLAFMIVMPRPCFADGEELHVAFSYTSTLSVSLAVRRVSTLTPLQSALVGFSLTQVAGLIKELAFDDRVDPADLAGNALGGFLGGMFYLVVQF